MVDQEKKAPTLVEIGILYSKIEMYSKTETAYQEALEIYKDYKRL